MGPVLLHLGPVLLYQDSSHLIYSINYISEVEFTWLYSGITISKTGLEYITLHSWEECWEG